MQRNTIERRKAIKCIATSAVVGSGLLVSGVSGRETGIDEHRTECDRYSSDKNAAQSTGVDEDNWKLNTYNVESIGENDYGNELLRVHINVELERDTSGSPTNATRGIGSYGDRADDTITFAWEGNVFGLEEVEWMSGYAVYPHELTIRSQFTGFRAKEYEFVDENYPSTDVQWNSSLLDGTHGVVFHYDPDERRTYEPKSCLTCLDHGGSPHRAKYVASFVLERQTDATGRIVWEAARQPGESNALENIQVCAGGGPGSGSVSLCYDFEGTNDDPVTIGDTQGEPFEV